MLNSLKKLRPWVMWFLALAVVVWYLLTDPDGGAETVMRLQWLAWLAVISGPVYLFRRALMDGARSSTAYDRAVRDPVGAGLVFLGLCILTGLLFLAFAGQARAATIPELVERAGLPPRASRYVVILWDEIGTHWARIPQPESIAGQVEKESCITLKHSKCWSPRAELKTSREYGFGLGQITITSRFDNFAAAKGLHESLRGWQWEDRYNARYQLRTMVLMMRGGFNSLAFIPDPTTRLIMSQVAYNSGRAGLLNDRRLCAGLAGCDPNQWYGNVEGHSTKSRVAAKGYGKSFYEISREYPPSIAAKSVKYRPMWEAA